MKLFQKFDEESFLDNERIAIYLEAVSIVGKYFKKEKFVRGNADQGPFGLAFLLYGMENFLVDLTDDTGIEEIEKLIEKCSLICLAFHRKVYEAGAHCTSFGDSAAGPELVSPAIYRRLAKPYQKILATELAKDDIKTICHICGNTNSILKDMADTGCAGFELDYKTDVSQIKESMQGKAVFVGNLDSSGVICNGNRDSIEKEVNKLFSVYKDGGWFILNAGCALPAHTPSENIKALVEANNRLGWYKKT